MKTKRYIIQLLGFRESLLINLVEWTKPWYTRFFKKETEAWMHSRESLCQFPLRSLGRELGDFLKREDLHLLPKLEDHDVMHVLMRYKTTVVDEARMQFFLLGNRKRSLYALVCALASVFLIPEYFRIFYREFQRGRHCAKVWAWDFRHLLHEPVDVLRQLLLKKNLGEEAPFIV